MEALIVLQSEGGKCPDRSKSQLLQRIGFSFSEFPPLSPKKAVSPCLRPFAVFDGLVRRHFDWLGIDKESSVILPSFLPGVMAARKSAGCRRTPMHAARWRSARWRARRSLHIQKVMTRRKFGPYPIVTTASAVFFPLTAQPLLWPSPPSFWPTPNPQKSPAVP